MLGVALLLTRFSSTWIVWAGLMVVMLYMFGPRHPRVFDEEVPLDRTRLLLALFALTNGNAWGWTVGGAMQSYFLKLAPSTPRG